LIVNSLNGGAIPADQIVLPPGYSGTMTMKQYDSMGIWWDYCTDNKWKVIWSTVPYSGAVAGGGGGLPFVGARAPVASPAYASGNMSNFVPWGGNDYDTNSFHAAGSPLFKMPYQGHYHVGAYAEVIAGGGTLNWVRGTLTYNSGAAVIARQTCWTPGLGTSGIVDVNVSADYNLNSGDSVQLIIDVDAVVNRQIGNGAMWVHQIASG
jgi:hypothetical protein